MKIEEEPMKGELLSPLSESEAGGNKECVPLKVPTSLWKILSTERPAWIVHYAVIKSSEEDVEREFVYLVAAPAILLSFVCQYFIGFIDKSIGKFGDEASVEERCRLLLELDFRNCKTLFQLTDDFENGFGDDEPGNLRNRSGTSKPTNIEAQSGYLGIKFKDTGSIRGGYRRPVRDKLSGTIKLSAKYEARYKPPRESGQNQSYLYLGMCATEEEVKMKKRIAAFYYGRNEGRLDLGDGRQFSIPSIPTEQVFSGLGKRTWVKDKVKKVYKEFLEAKDGRMAEFSPGPDEHLQQPMLATEVVGPVLDQGHNSVFASQCLRASPDRGNMSVDRGPSAEGETCPVEPPLWSSLDDEVDSFILHDNTDWSSEEFLNVIQKSAEVAATSSGVDVSAWIKQGAPHNSPTLSPILAPRQGSGAMEVLPDIVTPSDTNLCATNSTTELLAKVISLQEQMNQEQARKILELEREVERLRGSS